VRYLESAGARIIPILYNEPDQVTLEKLKKINAVFLPGGGGKYYEKGKFVFN
jgi:gamma-glutamyl hydrolase